VRLLGLGPLEWAVVLVVVAVVFLVARLPERK
jgi:Sec-independent protein translocase protein TatA